MANPKRLVFLAFGALPKPLRRWLIRTLRPSWTAGSVAVLERDDGRWLFVRPIYRKGWTLPGGLVDRGEQPSDTVTRELKEELGLTVEVTAGPWVIVDPELSRFETIYRVAVVDDIDLDTIEITTAELSALGWFDPADPPELEDETSEALQLTREITTGDPAVRFRGDTGR